MDWNDGVCGCKVSIRQKEMEGVVTTVGQKALTELMMTIHFLRHAVLYTDGIIILAESFLFLDQL